MLGRDAGARVRDQRGDVAVLPAGRVELGGDPQAATAGHGFLGVEQQIQKDLLQFAGVAVDGGQFLGEFQIHDDLCGLELVFEQGERVADDLVEVGVAKFRGRSAGEIQQAIGDFGSAEALLGDLVEHRAKARIALELLGEHLRVRGDDS